MPVEFLCGVLGLLALLLTITVVGHGLWLVLAAIVRAARGDSSHELSANSAEAGAEDQRLRAAAVLLDELFEKGEVRKSVCVEGLEGIAKRYARKNIPPPTWLRPRIELLKKEPGASPAPAPAISTSPLTPVGRSGARPSLSPPQEAPYEIVDAELVPAPMQPVPASRPLAPPLASTPAPWDVVEPPVAKPIVVLAPRKSLADILQSFMEESNIRWGEIIAGLCIVISAIGLVVSLRNALKAVPYFPAMLFLAFTLAFHGAALYTLRRWKLQVVSRAALLIALLLLPLNFAAGVMLGGEREHMRPFTDPLVLIAVTIGLAAGGWIAVSSGLALFSKRGWIAGACIVVCSLSEVALRRFAPGYAGLPVTLGLGAVPLAAFIVGLAAVILPLRNRSRFGPTHAQLVFGVLGTTLFAMLTPLAILLVDSVEVRERLADLAPILTVAVSLALGATLMVERRVRRREFITTRIVASAVATLSIAILVALLTAAWPRPMNLAIVCGVLAISFGVLAWTVQLPPLALASVLAGTLCWTMLVHLFTRSVDAHSTSGMQLLHALSSGRTAWFLLPAALASIGLGFTRWFSKPETKQWMTWGGMSVIGLSATIALLSGFMPLEIFQRDRSLASPLLLLYGAVLLAIAPSIGEKFVAPLGCGLLWSGLVHALWQNPAVRGRLSTLGILPQHPVHLSTLICAVLFGVVGGVLALVILGLTPIQLSGKARRRWRDTLSEPLAWAGLAAAIAAAPNALLPDLGDLSWNAKAAAALTIALLGVFLALRKAWYVSGMQLGLALLLFYSVAWWMIAAPKETAAWLAPKHLLVQLVVVSAGVLLWSGFRRTAGKSLIFREFALSPWSQVDRFFHVVALASCILLVSVKLVSGIAHEVAQGEFKIDAVWTTAIALSEWRYAAIWLSAAAVAGLIAYIEKPEWPRLLLVGITLYLSVPVGAIGFNSVASTASALRWTSAGLGLVLTGIFLSAPTWTRRIPRWLAPSDRSFPLAAYAPLWIGGVPVLVLTSLSVALELAGVAPGGPIAESFFARAGQVVSHGAPLFAVSLIFLIYSLVKHQPALAAVASAIFQFGVNLAFLLYAKEHLDRKEVLGIDWLTWNALAAGSFGLIWTLLFQRTGSDTLWGRRLHLGQLTIAARLGSGISLVLAGWLTVRIPPAPVTLATGAHWLTYLAVAIGVAPLVWRMLAIRAARWGRFSLAGLGLLAPLIAFSLGAANLGDPWIGHRTLEVGFAICLLAAAGIASLRPTEVEYARRDRNWIGYGSLWIAVWLLLLAVGARIEGSDPIPYWQEGCCVVAAIGCVVCGLVLAWELHAAVSVIAAALAGLLAAIFWNRGFPLGNLRAVDLGYIPLRSISAALFASLIWQGRAIWEDRLAMMGLGARTSRWVHHVTALLCLPLLCVLSIGMFGQIILAPIDRLPHALFLLAGLVIPFGFFFSAMWDRGANYSLPGQLTVGLCALLPLVAFCPIREVDLPPALGLAISLYVALCGQLFGFGANLANWGKKSGIPEVVEGLRRLQMWLPGVLLCVAAISGMAAFATVVGFDLLAMRTAAALAPFAAAWGIGNLASTDRRAYARPVAILWAVFGAILISWAQLPPVHDSSLLLERSFRLLVVLCSATLILGLILPRWILRVGTWFSAIRFSAAIVGVSAFVALGLTLALEVVHYRSGLPSPSDLHVVVVAVALLGLIAGLLSLALSKTLGKAEWSEEQRMAFVYVAQLTGGLLFAHLYFCRPVWFDPVVLPYWPYVLMGVAFASAGVGEIFGRSKIRVLAEPFQRSSLFLPLLPMLGMWLHAGSSDRALVLLVGAILYLLSSMSQKSWLSLAGAILAGNASLWTLFSERGFVFTDHPQMWLIPPAVCVLIAAQLQRNRLDATALASIRYLAMIVIYVSSTSEIFLRGMGKEFWPPIILMGLSVLGALLGIAFRVRAFLFLGFAFMLVALTCMVWYASTALFSHVWPWWAFGIGVGIAILILFGYFEKNRTQVQALIDRLRRWEA